MQTQCFKRILEDGEIKTPIADFDNFKGNDIVNFDISLDTLKKIVYFYSNNSNNFHIITNSYAYSSQLHI